MAEEHSLEQRRARAEEAEARYTLRGRYREITWAAVILGVLIGVVMNAAITYSGLKIGFTTGGSAIAAVIGWGVLRGMLRRGSIVENNIAQTIASAVNISNSGVIFTVPVLFLLGMEAQVDKWWLIAACTAGAILGVAFIVPTRKQMIDLERLRFPTGTAVAAVLKSPGEGVRKAYVLLAGIALSMVVFFFTKSSTLGLPGYAQFAEQLGIPGVSDDMIDVGAWIASTEFLGPFWHPAFHFSWAIAPFALGAGFITGKPGLVVLAGGLLAGFIITPVAYHNGWMPNDVALSGAAGWALKHINRPLGIGLLMGGAAVGLLLALPAIGGALAGMARAGKSGREREELPLVVLLLAVVGAFTLLYFAASHTIADSDPKQAALIAGIGTAWMWFSGIVIAQCTGMTDWSPISGMALLTVMLCLLLTDNQVVPAVLIGAAVCVAITLASDMMQDLKTGHLVGGKPVRQQAMELSVVWIGPAVSIGIVLLLARANQFEYGVAFGSPSDMTAPQAVALGGVVDTFRGGAAPVELYAMGGILGALLSFSGMVGLGVLVGLSMYLPIAYLLPYGLGCLLQMFFKGLKGAAWTESWCVPFAAGLIVGEGLLGVVFAAIAALK